MKIKVCSVYDVKGEMFQAPFFVPALGIAMRMFTDVVNDKSTPFGKYPGDFVLYQVGEFDDATGEFENVSPAKHLGIGTEYVDSRSGGVKSVIAEAVGLANGKEG